VGLGKECMAATQRAEVVILNTIPLRRKEKPTEFDRAEVHYCWRRRSSTFMRRRVSRRSSSNQGEAHGTSHLLSVQIL
jgi:hypothetical protein